jgi:hypothetical protein
MVYWVNIYRLRSTYMQFKIIHVQLFYGNRNRAFFAAPLASRAAAWQSVAIAFCTVRRGGNFAINTFRGITSHHGG